MKLRHILLPRWGGIEGGATLSDEQLIMWESIDPDTPEKQLVHRCYIDSDAIKDHGCVTRALDHAEGSISFIEAFNSGELEGAYNEVEFLENLGMYLGIAAHHICDLCTPVHVGHKIDFESLGFKSLNKFHNRVEKDIEKYQKKASIILNKAKTVKLDKDYFWQIAQHTHDHQFLKLSSIYSSENEDTKIKMTGEVISHAVRHTTNVWYTIIASTEMNKKEWSYKPLL